MPKLNDLQSILLATAAQREGGSLYPLPESVADAGARLPKALAGLTKALLVEERETGDSVAIRRTDGDLRFGVFITAAGSAAIGVGEEREDAAAPVVDSHPAAPAPGPRATKAGAVLALLQRDAGATLAELIATTGWLPHTTRAALTGLREKGHAIERDKRNGVTCYRITAGTAA